MIERMNRPRVPQGIEAGRVVRSGREGGVERVRIQLPADDYYTEIGFREFGKFTSDWLSSANEDPKTKHTPFIMDAGHPAVQRIATILKGHTRHETIDNPNTTRILCEEFSKIIPSALRLPHHL